MVDFLEIVVSFGEIGGRCGDLVAVRMRVSWEDMVVGKDIGRCDGWWCVPVLLCVCACVRGSDFFLDW